MENLKKKKLDVIIIAYIKIIISSQIKLLLKIQLDL